MGTFELPEKHAQVLWADGSELDGFEATLSLDAPIDLLLRMADYESLSAAEQRELMLAFGDSVLVSWNLTRKGKAVPATGAGMLSHPARLMVAIMKRWREVVAADPLGERSSDTTGSVAPLGMTGT